MRLYLDGEQFQRLASANAAAYKSAKPFPHAVFDDVLPSEMLDEVLRDFPDPGSEVWREYRNYHEGKLETQGEANLSDATSLVLYQFNSAPFIRFLETLTGVTGLIPDPYFLGGGLHQIPRGGKLGIHADFSSHHTLGLDRRLNVLIYLNREWREEYGGHLELWAPDRSRCVTSIAPVFNRMVVFTITDWAFHGHPESLTCPEGRTRKSIALYYYTAGRPAGETMPSKTSTLFVQRPGEVVPPGTIFQRDDTFDGLVRGPESTMAPTVEPESPEPPPESKLRKLAKALTPPIVVTGARRLRRPRER